MANEAVILRPYKIEKHPNADRLDLLTLRGEGGFTCVVGRNQFSMSDFVLYIEPDSVIPDNIKEYLEETSKIKISSRIRAIKLRGIISEGLCLKPEDFLKPIDIVEDKDVSSLIGVTHYEPPPPKGQGWKSVKGTNPWYKNKAFRIYNHIDRFEKVCRCFEEGMNVHISTKLHGMNWRAGICPKEPKNWWQKLLQKLCILPKNEFLVGSHKTVRNVGKKGKPLPPEMENQDNFILAARKYDIETKLRELYHKLNDKNIVLYGELIGWGVNVPLQKGYWYGIPKGDVELRIFDIMVDGKYLDMDIVLGLCREYNLPHVDTLYEGPFNLDLLSLAQAVDKIGNWKGNREGIVIKAQPAKHDPRMGYVVAKKINPKYLLDKSNTEHH
jgi:RNA ligase (TIGR02306 family)